jgi:hypothetical protein
MATPTKFLGAIEVESWSFQVDEDPPGGPVTISLDDGTYYLSDDGGSDDLIAEIESKAAASALADNLYIAISADGIASITNDGTTATITWTANGTELRDILRFTGATTGPIDDNPTSADRACRYFAHSTTATNVDVPTDLGRTSLSEADDGTLYGLDVGPLIQQYRVKVRYSGPHRTTTANGYTEFRDLWIYSVKPGRKMRWYPDTAVTTAWAELTNPTGYHVVKALEPRTFTPTDVIRDYYGWYTTTFLLQVQP